jgi:allantoinase
VETCPHYLSLTASDVPDGGTQFKCAPPIRSAANQDALWQALADGDIDLVVSDHSPSMADLKFKGDGDFAQAWGGIAGVQLGLSAVWTEAASRGVALEDVVRWMAASPAAFAGLGRKGLIDVGRDADLVVFAPDERFTVHASELLHKNPVSAYDGAELRGVVRRTFLRGTEPGHGTLLRRG